MCYRISITEMEPNETHYSESHLCYNYVVESQIGRVFDCSVRLSNIAYRIVLLPVLIVTGIIGQLFSMKIFLSLKNWKATYRVYYFAIAAADLVYLIGFAIPEWTGEGLDLVTHGAMKFNPENLSTITCRAFRYLWHSSWFISCWLLIAYSVERLIALSYPLYRIRFISIRMAKVTCTVVIIVGIIGFLPVILTEIYRLSNENGPISNRYCYFNENISQSTFLVIWVLLFPFS